MSKRRLPFPSCSLAVGLLLLLGLGLGFGASSCKKKAEDEQEEPGPTPGPSKLTDDAAPSPEVREAAAFLIDKSGKLWRVDPKGEAEELGEFHAELWCQADSESQVVWGLGRDGLVAFDVATKVSQPIVDKNAGDGSHEAGLQDVLLRFPGEREIGNVNSQSSDVALVVSVGSVPSLRADVVCDGDRVPYCYDSMEGDDPKGWTLSKTAQAQLASYQGLSLYPGAESEKHELGAGGVVMPSASEFLVEVAKRVEGKRDSQPPSQSPPPPSVDVPKTHCREIPEDCGRLRYLGGGRLWAIVTENDRGDYFYEAEQIYDAEAKVFVDFEEGTTSKKPFDVASGAAFMSDPTRDFALTPGGKLIDLGEAKVVRAFDGYSPCGWL